MQLKTLINSSLDGLVEVYDGEKSVNKTIDGDFRSDDCIKFLKSADIIVTNPPFSLFREYVAQLVEYGKEFLVIGNFNAVTYKEIFPLIKDNKIWLGYTHPKKFLQPDGSIKKFGNITWFTNVSVSKRLDVLSLQKYYKDNESRYPKYDNYNAINVDRVKDIPKDYYGYMGVPITFLNKYSPNQFKILGIMNTGEENHRIRLPNTPHGRPIVNGKEKYLRYIIQRICD